MRQRSLSKGALRGKRFGHAKRRGKRQPETFSDFRLHVYVHIDSATHSSGYAKLAQMHGLGSMQLQFD